MVVINKGDEAGFIEAASNFGLSCKDGVFYTNSLFTRIYIKIDSDKVFISTNINDLKKNDDVLARNCDAWDFYNKFGFVYPPYTIYKNIYLLSPYTGVEFNGELNFKVLYPVDSKVSFGNDKEFETELENDLFQILNEVDEHKSYAVLFSGGVDSSVLLTLANELGKVKSAINCFMPSMSNETSKAFQMCSSKGIEMQKIIIDTDLTAIAESFVEEFSEPVSDSISMVIPEILDKSDISPGQLVLDGQGADSLFSGLPHDKVADLYSIKILRAIFRPFAFVPVYQNKESSIGRLIYRITKVIKCMSHNNASNMLVESLVEHHNVKLSDSNEVMVHLKKDLAVLSSRFEDFHMVIRYIFMFKILFAREMQKYLLSEKNGFEFSLPFLQNDFIAKYFYAPPCLSISKPQYKLPLLNLAKKYWPDFFNTSKTSPFQVEFTVEDTNIKDFSRKKLQGTPGSGLDS